MPEVYPFNILILRPDLLALLAPERFFETSSRSTMTNLSESATLSTRARIAIVVIGALIFLPFGYAIATSLQLPKGIYFPFSFALGAAVVWALLAIAPFVWRLAQSSVCADFIPTHRNAEKRVILSGVESSIASGDSQRALEQFDALIDIHGIDERLCRRAVDFYLGKQASTMPDALQRGEALLRRMRSERVEQFERYATQRLIDLYMMKTETYAKAITELRRMVARFPGTPEAAGAMVAIEQLKAL